MSSVKILSVNEQGARLAACAAKISTTKGGAEELFYAASDGGADNRLIGKVLKSGHYSILEHIYFNIAVSASSIAEQFFIEFRLASFTVKSRRYVDFSGAGFYEPGGMPEGYGEFAARCFGAYKELLEAGVSMEDARFVLPRCFLSEFYISVNARELIHIVSRMDDTEELRELKRQLTGQLKEASPAVYSACADGQGGGALPARFGGGAYSSPVTLISSTSNKEGLLSVIGEPDIKALVNSARPRALEHLSYTFALTGLTYAGLTHLTRHRMLSLTVYENADFSANIADKLCGALNGNVSYIFKNSFDMARDFSLKCGGRREALEYSKLCGHAVNAAVTMNARELLLFFKLRLCERAQWEIRDYARAMLKLCREDFPALFGLFGPSCFVTGKCPEGRLSCGKIDKIRMEFGADN